MLSLNRGRQNLSYNFSNFFGNTSLKQSIVTKFLGVYFNEHLTWKHHIPSCAKKLLTQSV